MLNISELLLAFSYDYQTNFMLSWVEHEKKFLTFWAKCIQSPKTLSMAISFEDAHSWLGVIFLTNYF